MKKAKNRQDNIQHSQTEEITNECPPDKTSRKTQTGQERHKKNQGSNNTFQVITTGADNFAYTPGGSIHLPLIYNVSTGDANLSGLTLNVHYNSTLLAPEAADHGVSGMIEAAISTTADLPDVDDLDNDPITDRMVQLVWASFDNSFPDQDLPLQLATVSFESLESLPFRSTH